MMKRRVGHSIALGLLAFGVVGCGSAVPSFTALELQNAIADSELPCFGLESRSTESGATALVCYPMADSEESYSLIIFDDESKKADYQIDACLRDRVGGSALSNNPLVNGANWYGIGSDGSLVSATDIAREIGGVATDWSSVCEGFATQLDAAESNLAEQRSAALIDAASKIGPFKEACEADKSRVNEAEAVLTVKAINGSPGIFVGVADTSEQPEYFCPTDAMGEVSFPLPGTGVYRLVVNEDLLPAEVSIPQDRLDEEVFVVESPHSHLLFDEPTDLVTSTE